MKVVVGPAAKFGSFTFRCGDRAATGKEDATGSRKIKVGRDPVEVPDKVAQWHIDSSHLMKAPDKNQRDAQKDESDRAAKAKAAIAKQHAEAANVARAQAEKAGAL